jgi:hypothetical protein
LFYLEPFIHGPSSDFELNLNSSKTLFATHPLQEPELGEIMRTFKAVASEVDEFPPATTLANCGH